MQYKKHFASLFLLMFSLLHGCTSLIGLEAPTLDLLSIRPITSDGLAPRFEITLKITNPNSQPISLRGAAYGLSLNGFDVVHGVSQSLPEVPAYGEAKFKLPAELSVLQGMKLLASFYQKPQADLSYRLDVKLDAGAFWPNIHLSESGRLNPLEFTASLNDRSL